MRLPDDRLRQNGPMSSGHVDHEGFIHCSFADQVQGVADRFYCGRHDVLLLVIDPSQLPAEPRVENLDGGTELFPHLYGPLPVAAVLKVEPVAVDTQAGWKSPHCWPAGSGPGAVLLG